MSADRSAAFLSVRDVMARLRKRHAFVRELIAGGQLETREIEGREVVTAASFDRYVGRVPAAQGIDAQAFAALLRRAADLLAADAAK